MKQCGEDFPQLHKEKEEKYIFLRTHISILQTLPLATFLTDLSRTTKLFHVLQKEEKFDVVTSINIKHKFGINSLWCVLIFQGIHHYMGVLAGVFPQSRLVWPHIKWHGAATSEMWYEFLYTWLLTTRSAKTFFCFLLRTEYLLRDRYHDFLSPTQKVSLKQTGVIS